MLKAREVAYHLADSDAKAYFAFEGTPELPIGQAAWEGFRATEGCTEFFLIESGLPTHFPWSCLRERLQPWCSRDRR
ncbi:hypothetical protein ABZ619_41295 [Streptomyces sp. NPDC007851]|uniref:hypothetical protein n=1 Tax=Streptomyces sp. NPDC007851 TaxID=3155008 RepID=UPI0033CB1E67